MTVLNKHHSMSTPGAIYIGRGSIWGNPYIIGKDGNRNEVCNKYRELLKDKLDTGVISMEQLINLHGKDLMCWCAPLRCHGHHLEKLAEQAFNKA